MSFKKVRRGDALLPHLTAEWYNSTIPPESSAPGAALDESDPAGNNCRIKIYNNTGSNLDRYSIVGLDGPVFDASYGAGSSYRNFLNGLPAVVGSLPVASTHAYRFAVLLQSCKAGCNAEAVIIGAVPVLVYVTSTNHTYADVTTGVTSYLTSGSAGGAKLLNTPTVTGLQWCIVRTGIQPTASAGRAFVEFNMKGVLNGFNTSGGNVKLDNANQSGWLGSTQKFGNEVLAGIEYQDSETAPQTNGLYKATKNGTWLCSIRCPEVRLQSTELATPSAGTVTYTTSGPSTGTAHTHTVTAVKSGMIGPRLYCRAYKKPTASGIVTTGDYYLQSFPYIETSGNEWEFSVHWFFVIPLLQNEKVSFEWSNSGSDRTAYSFDFTVAESGGYGRISFDYLDDYLGQSIGWRNVTTDP